MELPHPLQMSIQLRKLRLLIQNVMILQLRHATFITECLKEIYSGRETGLIDTGPKFGIPTSMNIGDMHRTQSGTDGRTVRLLYASQSSFGGIIKK